MTVYQVRLFAASEEEMNGKIRRTEEERIEFARSAEGREAHRKAKEEMAERRKFFTGESDEPDLYRAKDTK